MSSFYEDASLVMIPSGYKTSKVYCAKPTDGAGDLTFTRSNDTATRVNSAGLIEKVRTNLLLQSNGFNTASWIKFGSGAGLAPVITANAGTAPDGTNNAFRVQFNCVGTTSSDRSILNQSITSVNSTPHTSSVYIKAFSAGEVGKQVRFITEQNGSQIIITLTADWQRVVNVGTSVATSLNFVLETRGSVTANTTADVLLAFAQLETGDIATPYIATTSAAVSVGPVANVPRLDYLNSSCPRLLLEPQRQNVITFSEQMDNAAWNKIQSSVTANAGTSPDGYTNADKFIPNTSNVIHFVTQTISSVSASWTYSIFAKAAGYDRLILNAFNTNYVGFNLTSGIVESSLGTGVTSANIENYGNGWYRCSITSTSTATGTNVAISVFNAAYTNGNTNPQFAGNGTDGILIYGAQLEQGSYSTSLIPTLGAAVTRGADAASKTGISSLIGQTEGTFFAEVTLLGNTGSFNVLNTNNVTTNSITLHIEGSKVRGYVYANSVLRNSIIGGSLSVGNTYKMAYAYKSGDAALYLNGVQIGTASQTWSFSASVDKIELADPDTYFSYQEGIKFAQALLFKTRLSNSDLAALTTL